MTSELRRSALGQSALSYLRDTLKTGLTIPRELSEGLCLESGTVFAFLPLGIEPATIERFEFGGVVSLCASRTHLVRFLKTMDREYPNSLVLFENRCVQPRYPVFTRCKSHVVAFNDEVYHVGSTSQSDGDLLTALKESATAVETSVLGISIRADQFDELLAIDSATRRERLAANCIFVAVSAFDGEGYVIWSRQNEKTVNSKDLKWTPKTGPQE